jgi:hypothetical protein
MKIGCSCSLHVFIDCCLLHRHAQPTIRSAEPFSLPRACGEEERIKTAKFHRNSEQAGPVFVAGTEVNRFTATSG